MEAGRLRHRVTIEQPSDAQDSSTGALTRSWSTLATVWAEIAPLSAKEFIAAQAVDSEVSARITIRYRDDVTAAMRIVYGSTVYNIAGVLPDPVSGKDWLTLPVTRGVNDG